MRVPTLTTVLYKLIAGCPYMTEERLVSSVYLVDWRSSIENDRTVTGSVWTYAGRPTSREVWSAILSDPNFIRHHQLVAFRRDIVLSEDAVQGELSGADEEVVDFVINGVGQSGLMDFQRIVASTYPIINYSSRRLDSDTLDLPELAAQYKDFLINSDELERIATVI